jgi:ribosome-binding factor A
MNEMTNTRHKPSYSSGANAGTSGGTGRGHRVAEQVHHELAQLIQRELKDPRIGFVTVTGVDLTPDFSYVTVFFTCIPSDEESIKKALEGLRQAAGFLRMQLGKRVRIHQTPEVRFAHDVSLDRGFAMDALIKEAQAKRADSDDTP